MNQEQLALLALHCIPGIGGFTIRQLISYCGSARQVFNRPPGKLRKVPGIRRTSIDLILKNEGFHEAEALLQRAEKENSKIILYSDDDFPRRLKNVFDAPTILFHQGNADFNSLKSLAIVGTRKASSYGLGFVDELIEGLARHQPLIVSGLAYGIDIRAHRAALKNGLSTVGVLASGTNIIYPAAHKNTAKEMVTSGGLVSEYGFDILPDPKRFPARNRIIAGTTDATIVIEAAARGGALITAHMANGYDRDVFALPGNVHNTHSLGCNHLIKTHKAHILTRAEDIEYIMQWDNDTRPAKIQPDLSALDAEEKAVVKALSDTADAITIDELSWRAELPINKLASVLLNLEFRGYVNPLPGKIYKLSGELARF
ncbi:MAG: DNA-processing protein DprA [Cyclobacteriaceae bacterium]|nr:DNA-processing protein DprA [Cyclobacteriaceae bacterium]